MLVLSFDFFKTRNHLTVNACLDTCLLDDVSGRSVFRRRGRLCLSGPLRILSRIGQEEPFDLSQKNLSPSDGGSSGREEDEDSLYSPELYKPREEETKPDHSRF